MEEKISQEQFYDMLLSREIGWKEIIYELVASQQLDPWNIDIVLLTQQYIEKIKKYEEINFFISSKVLLAASVLLRIKCELLLSKYVGKIDELFFGPRPQISKQIERIYIDEEELPELLPKTPLPRQRKITLPELIDALEKAIEVQSRKEKKKIFVRPVFFPPVKINIKEKISQLYEKIKNFFLSGKEKLTFSYLAGNGRKEKIETFIPLLHLDSQEKISMQQEKHLGEIFISLR